MTIHVQAGKILSLEQIRAFLESSEEIRFKGKRRAEVCAWVTRTLSEQGYAGQGRAGKGLLRQYLGKMTGLSRAQLTRLIGRYRQAGEVKEALYRRHRFPNKYTRRDVELLAELDQAHEGLSGPATRRILEREFREFGHKQYERLAGISVAQIYRLRKQAAYHQRRIHFTKTRPTAVSIGERRRPNPQGQPGYLRVDTVHQEDRDGVKGVDAPILLDSTALSQLGGTSTGRLRNKGA